MMTPSQKARDHRRKITRRDLRVLTYQQLGAADEQLGGVLTAFDGGYSEVVATARAGRAIAQE